MTNTIGTLRTLFGGLPGSGQKRSFLTSAAFALDETCFRDRGVPRCLRRQLLLAPPHRSFHRAGHTYIAQTRPHSDLVSGFLQRHADRPAYGQTRMPTRRSRRGLVESCGRAIFFYNARSVVAVDSHSISYAVGLALILGTATLAAPAIRRHWAVALSMLALPLMAQLFLPRILSAQDLQMLTIAVLVTSPIAALWMRWHHRRTVAPALQQA